MRAANNLRMILAWVLCLCMAFGGTAAAGPVRDALHEDKSIQVDFKVHADTDACTRYFGVEPYEMEEICRYLEQADFRLLFNLVDRGFYVRIIPSIQGQKLPDLSFQLKDTTISVTSSLLKNEPYYIRLDSISDIYGDLMSGTLEPELRKGFSLIEKISDQLTEIQNRQQALSTLQKIFPETSAKIREITGRGTSLEPQVWEYILHQNDIDGISQCVANDIVKSIIPLPDILLEEILDQEQQLSGVVFGSDGEIRIVVTQDDLGAIKHVAVQKADIGFILEYNRTESSAVPMLILEGPEGHIEIFQELIIPIATQAQSDISWISASGSAYSTGGNDWLSGLAGKYGGPGTSSSVPESSTPLQPVSQYYNYKLFMNIRKENTLPQTIQLLDCSMEVRGTDIDGRFVFLEAGMPFCAEGTFSTGEERAALSGGTAISLSRKFVESLFFSVLPALMEWGEQSPLAAEALESMF